MRLGTRWAAGSEPPATVPAALRPGLAEAERRAATAGAFWTLTWLEGRPIAELDAGWEVLLTAEEELVVRPFED